MLRGEVAGVLMVREVEPQNEGGHDSVNHLLGVDGARMRSCAHHIRRELVGRR
jgi:hypothetical protein